MQNDSTKLHVAAQNGDIKAISVLLQEGAVVDVEDRYGQTPLHELLSLPKPKRLNISYTIRSRMRLE